MPQASAPDGSGARYIWGHPVKVRNIAAVVIATLAVSGGGIATAATLIDSSDVKNNSLRGTDVRNGTIACKDLSKGLQNRICKTWPPKGTPGAKGDTGAAGAPGAPGSQGQTGAPGAPAGDSRAPRAVTAAALGGWLLAPYGDNSTVDGRGTENDVPNGTLTFAAPPAPAPLGSTALRYASKSGDYTTDPDAGRSVVAYVPLPAAAENRMLTDLTTASYSSLIDSTPQAALDAAFKMEVTGAKTVAGGIGYTTMVFEPYQNGASETADQWHRHNVRGGEVWSSRPLTSGDCTQANTCSVDTFLAQNPQAVVQSAKVMIGQNSGQGWPNFVGFVDDVRFGFDGDYARYNLGG